MKIYQEVETNGFFKLTPEGQHALMAENVSKLTPGYDFCDINICGSKVCHCYVFIWKSILIINTPCRRPVHPCGGPKVPLLGTGTPSEGLVRFFHNMQLYLIRLEGLADGLLSVNPSPRVTTCIIGQLIP